MVLLQNHWDDFSWFDFKIGGFGFFGLGLKIGSYDLMIYASKSLQRFLSLCLKIKRATVYQLHHKTDGMMKTVQDARRDLVTLLHVEASYARVF
jgi:hypothetical protein